MRLLCKCFIYNEKIAIERSGGDVVTLFIIIVCVLNYHKNSLMIFIYILVQTLVLFFFFVTMCKGIIDNITTNDNNSSTISIESSRCNKISK